MLLFWSTSDQNGGFDERFQFLNVSYRFIDAEKFMLEPSIFVNQVIHVKILYFKLLVLNFEVIILLRDDVLLLSESIYFLVEILLLFGLALKFFLELN